MRGGADARRCGARNWKGRLCKRLIAVHLLTVTVEIVVAREAVHAKAERLSLCFLKKRKANCKEKME